MLLLQLLYAFSILWLSLYGVQSFLLTFLYLRHRRDAEDAVAIAEDQWPSVAVQLPVYNERHVVERLIDAAAALDYPRDRLEIQVLDDSTDDTTAIAGARTAFHRSRGVAIEVLRRPDREGYKAGALAWGLRHTGAEYLAVFDADFCPHPDFLRNTIPHLVMHPEAGVAQTRWSHLNESYSAITRVQALALNGHFMVEQTGRNRSGLLINFNGSGGVWRRACIEDAGGWQWDTLTEDMDLSYRAQLAGWRSIYLPEVDAPAELPPQIEAFKSQQARWAQGSTQCLRKLAPRILGSGLTPAQKLGALVHISSYFTQPLVILLLLVSVPMLLLAGSGLSLFGSLWVVSLGPPTLYLVAEAALGRAWQRRLIYFPVLAAVAIGITVSTSAAVLKGLVRSGGTFRRTPKFAIEGRRGSWANSSYRMMPGPAALAELLLALYALIAIGVAWATAHTGAIPFLVLYALGFGLVGGTSLVQGRRSPMATTPGTLIG